MVTASMLEYEALRGGTVVDNMFCQQNMMGRPCNRPLVLPNNMVYVTRFYFI